jgi:ketosteroid isomerase-like protein
VSGESEESPERSIEIVRLAYVLFAEGVELGRAGRWDEWSSLPSWDLLDPGVVLEELAEIPDSDSYRGVEGIKRWVRAGTETFEDARWEQRDFTVRGPHVLVDARGHFRGAGSGVETQLDVTHVFTLSGGRIVRIAAFLDRAKALEAAGSSE